MTSIVPLVLTSAGAFATTEVGPSCGEEIWPIESAYAVADLSTARALNQRGFGPFDALKHIARHQPKALALIAELEAEATTKRLAVSWNEERPDDSHRGESHITFGITTPVGPDGLAMSLFVLKHELTHEPFPLALQRFEQTRAEYERTYRERVVEEELRVRLLDRRTFRRLTEIGLRLPDRSALEINWVLWTMSDHRMSNSEMLNYMRSVYQASVDRILAANYDGAFFNLWISWLDVVLASPTAELVNELSSQIVASGINQGRSTSERLDLLKSVLSHYAVAGRFKTSTEHLARIRRRLIDATISAR